MNKELNAKGLPGNDRIQAEDSNIAASSDTRSPQSDVFADNLYDQVFKVWARAEIERRVAEGVVAEGYMPWAVQVLMEPDAPNVIRFDHEVRGLIRIPPGLLTEAKEQLSPITFHEIADKVTNFELSENDSQNAGHISLIRHQKGFFIAFDFTYNAARVAEHLELAREYLEVSRFSIERGMEKPFIANLHLGVELLAKSALLRIPAKDIVRSKSHHQIRVQYNLYSQAGAIEPRFASLLNKLDSVRNPARYLTRAVRLGEGEADEMLATANEMYTQVASRSPFRTQRAVEKIG